MSSEATTLILAVVQPEDAPALQRGLSEAGIGATYLTARGGFLRRHAVAVLALVGERQVGAVVRAARATCSRRRALITPVAETELGYVPEPIEVEIGGAVIFGLPVAAVAPLGGPKVAAPALQAMAGRGPAGEEIMVDREATKLLIAVVPDRAAGAVVDALIGRHFGATTIGSSGGFLRRGNTTILTAVPADEAEACAQLLQAAVGASAEDDEHGIAFAVPVEWRLRL